MRKGKEKKVIPDIKIEKIAAEGKCLGHLPDERIVFVPYAAPGDLVDVLLTKRRKAYAEGHIERLVTPSPLRITPKCQHFGTCGGCKWQHLPYTIQLEAKEQQVYDQLERIGKVHIEKKLPILGSLNTYAYRNKLEFTFSQKRWKTAVEIASNDEIKDQEGLGFHISGCFDKILDIKECHLMNGLNNDIRLFIKNYCLSHDGYTFYNLREHHGLMRSLMLRISPTTREVMLVVVFGEDDKKRREQLLSAIQNKFHEITSLMYVINQKMNDTIADQEVILFSGKDHIWEEMEGLRFKIGPKSFYQTNSHQAYELYSIVRDFASLTEHEVVYDLYTGTGTIASFLSPKAKKVFGIEYVDAAIEDARINLEINHIKNVEYFSGDMKDILTQEFVNFHGTPDVIITDPPRAGMHPSVVETILSVSPQRIVYVSCNPASQARDLQLLQQGYNVTKAQPVDMFPQTHHVENVVLLERRL